MTNEWKLVPVGTIEFKRTEPYEAVNGNDARYIKGRNDGWEEGWQNCIDQFRKLNSNQLLADAQRVVGPINKAAKPHPVIDNTIYKGNKP